METICIGTSCQGENLDPLEFRIFTQFDEPEK